MKKKIDQIYEYVERTILAADGKGVKTEEVASALNMQRTNVSTLLNQLCSEGKLNKSTTRPVVYTLSERLIGKKRIQLDDMVGRNGSLKPALDALEAAIAYPGGNMRMMMLCGQGDEHSYIALNLRNYAVDRGFMDKDAPFVSVNCGHYLKNVKVLDEKIFGAGGNLNDSAFAHAQNGLLYIRNVQYLTAEQQAAINEFMGYGLIYDVTHTRYIELHHIALLLSAPEDQLPAAFNEMPQVRIPHLADRPIGEKYSLIQLFFKQEAQRAGLSIGVSTQAITALLMTNEIINVRMLGDEIKAACAAAYIRALNDHMSEMQVLLNDFAPRVRKGILLSKEHSEIETILKSANGEVIYFDASGKSAPSGEIYSAIKKKMDDFAKRGISTDKLISSSFIPHKIDVAQDFEKRDLKENVSDEFLDRRIMAMAEIVLEEYEKKAVRKVDPGDVQRLSVYINALMHHQSVAKLNDSETKEIVETHPDEFEICLYLGNCLREFHVTEREFSVNEIAMMAKILLNPHTDHEKHPVLLYVMHGDHTASALAEVTNSLTHLGNAYAFDMHLSYSIQEALDHLKEVLMRIDQGQGVIVIYDMGSIRTMLETIMEETKINIRMISVPVTVYGLEVAWKAGEMMDIDDVYNDIRTTMRNYREEPEKKNELFITLCETGQGGAQELKRYIDRYSSLGIRTEALAISNKSELLKRVSELQKIYSIRAFIGTYDPKLFGIPFISASRVFRTSHEHLDQVLTFEPIEDKTQDYEQVYKMLAESLHYTSISKLKSTLPEIVDNLAESYHLNDNRKDGLFVHLACSVERLLSGDEEKPAIDPEQKKKIMRLNEDYGVVSRQVRKLEKAFNVIFDDDEIAIIIMILRKI